MGEQEEINKANEDAEKIVLLFVKDFFGEEAEKKANQVIDLLNIGVDNNPKTAELCPAYYNGEDEIYITEKCINEYKNSIYLIICLIHEYAHAFSKLISKGKVNDVVEEALANLFVEIAIKYYIQKGNKINYVSENENNELVRDIDIYMRNTYISEGDFTQAIMFALRTKKKDIKALGEYYFGNKNNFVDICENTIEPQLREVLIDDLMKVDIHRGVNNRDLYLPQASRKLRNILGNFFNFLIDELDLGEQESELYSAEGSLMEAIYFENKLEHAWLPQIGFTNIRKDNIELLSSNVDIKALQELGDRNIEKMRLNCSKLGYSDLIKALIRKWYYANKEDEASFEKIMSLTSAIPFDVFLEIMQDKQITNVNEIMYYLAKYHVLEDNFNYENILELLNQKVGNRFNKEEYVRQEKIAKKLREKNIEDPITDLNEKTLMGLAKLNLTNEELKKVLYIYNNSVSQISLDNIFDIIDILIKIDYSTLSENDMDNLLELARKLSKILYFKYKYKERELDDISLLMKLEQLPNEIYQIIKSQLYLHDLDKHVSKAIDSLAQYGYEIENRGEIIYQNIWKENYKNIRIVPNINTKTLPAFSKEINKTNILLNTCINQFLNIDAPSILEEENYVTCLMLLENSTQSDLGLSDETIRRICISLQDKIIELDEFNSEKKDKLEETIKERLSELDAKILLRNFFEDTTFRNEDIFFMKMFLINKKINCKQAEEIITYIKWSEFSNEEYQKNIAEKGRETACLENIYRVLEIMDSNYLLGEGILKSINVGYKNIWLKNLMLSTRRADVNMENQKIREKIYFKLKAIEGMEDSWIEYYMFKNQKDKLIFLENLKQMQEGKDESSFTARDSEEERES